MRKYKSTIIGLLVSATVALAFIQIDDTHVQTILTGAIKTFQDAIHFQATGGGTNYVGIVAPATVPTPVVFKLPGSDGTSGQAVVTDGSANLSFASIAGSVPTATPLAFGTPGVIPVFASPELGSYAGATCPTPGTVISALSASGAPTCSPSGGTCPAGSDTYVQYNDSGSCGADGSFYWLKTPKVLNVRSTTSGVIPLVELGNTVNSAGNGAWYYVFGGGTSASKDIGMTFDRGAATGGVGQYLMMGVASSDGTFRLLENAAFIPDASTGTGLLEVHRGTGNNQILIEKGDGTATVPALGFINDNDTGWSYFNPAGSSDQINTIAHNNLITHHTWLTGSSGVFGIDARTVLTPKVDTSISGAGPVQETCDTSLLELQTSNGAGTAIVLTLTNSQEGQVCRVMNLGSNDLTFATASAAGYDQITTASAVQTLSNEGDTIEFISHLDSGTGAQRWYQSQAVAGP